MIGKKVSPQHVVKYVIEDEKTCQVCDHISHLHMCFRTGFDKRPLVLSCLSANK